MFSLMSIEEVWANMNDNEKNMKLSSKYALNVNIITKSTLSNSKLKSKIKLYKLNQQ